MLFSLPNMYNCIYILPFLRFEDTSFTNFASTPHIFDNVRILLIKILHPQLPKIHYRRYPTKIAIHNGLPAKFCSLIHLACDNVHIENKYQSYSFLIAASGLNFIALSAGKYPATIPISIANAMEAITSQGGI